MDFLTLLLRMNFKNFVFALTILLLQGCVKNNPDPSWLYIDKWTLVANPELSGAEGELSQSITEAWVYINDNCVGVYELRKYPVGVIHCRRSPSCRLAHSVFLDK